MVRFTSTDYDSRMQVIAALVDLGAVTLAAVMAIRLFARLEHMQAEVLTLREQRTVAEAHARELQAQLEKVVDAAEAEQQQSPEQLLLLRVTTQQLEATQTLLQQAQQAASEAEERERLAVAEAAAERTLRGQAALGAELVERQLLLTHRPEPRGTTRTPWTGRSTPRSKADAREMGTCELPQSACPRLSERGFQRCLTGMDGRRCEKCGRSARQPSYVCGAPQDPRVRRCGWRASSWEPTW